MKIEAPRTGIDPLSTALAQAAAAQSGAGAHAIDLLTVAGAHLGLSGSKAQTGNPAGSQVSDAAQRPGQPPSTAPGENTQARMPALPPTETPVDDDYDAAAILRAHRQDPGATAERPAAPNPDRPDHPLPVATTHQTPPTPPAPVELRQPDDRRRARAAATSPAARQQARRKTAARRWIMRGPALWLGASLGLVAVALIFL